VKAVLLAVALLGLAGCARYYWTKPGATPEQFSRDSLECAREASPTESMRQQGIVQVEAYRTCLTSRGYTRDKQLEPVPPGSYRGIE